METKYASGFFKALGDETRLSILLYIADKERTVTEIVAHVQKAQPTVSLHLRHLELKGFINCRKKSRHAYYSLKDRRVEQVIALLYSGGQDED